MKRKARQLLTLFVVVIFPSLVYMSLGYDRIYEDVNEFEYCLDCDGINELYF